MTRTDGNPAITDAPAAAANENEDNDEADTSGATGPAVWTISWSREPLGDGTRVGEERGSRTQPAFVIETELKSNPSVLIRSSDAGRKEENSSSIGKWLEWAWRPRRGAEAQEIVTTEGDHGSRNSDGDDFRKDPLPPNGRPQPDPSAKPDANNSAESRGHPALLMRWTPSTRGDKPDENRWGSPGGGDGVSGAVVAEEPLQNAAGSGNAKPSPSPEARSRKRKRKSTSSPSTSRKKRSKLQDDDRRCSSKSKKKRASTTKARKTAKKKWAGFWLGDPLNQSTNASRRTGDNDAVSERPRRTRSAAGAVGPPSVSKGQDKGRGSPRRKKEKGKARTASEILYLANADVETGPDVDGQRKHPMVVGSETAKIMGMYFAIPCTVFAIVIGIGLMVLGTTLQSDVHRTVRVFGAAALTTGAMLFVTSFFFGFCALLAAIQIVRADVNADHERKKAAREARLRELDELPEEEITSSESEDVPPPRDNIERRKAERAMTQPRPAGMGGAESSRPKAGNSDEFMAGNSSDEEVRTLFFDKTQLMSNDSMADPYHLDELSSSRARTPYTYYSSVVIFHPYLRSLRGDEPTPVAASSIERTPPGTGFAPGSNAPEETELPSWKNNSEVAVHSELAAVVNPMDSTQCGHFC